MKLFDVLEQIYESGDAKGLRRIAIVNAVNEFGLCYGCSTLFGVDGRIMSFEPRIYLGETSGDYGYQLISSTDQRTAQAAEPVSDELAAI